MKKEDIHEIRGIEIKKVIEGLFNEFSKVKDVTVIRKNSFRVIIDIDEK